MSGFKVNFSVNNQLATPSMHAAALANRPAAGQPGRVFIDTNNPSTGIYRDTGTIWIQIGAVAGALNLQNVTDNGNTTDNTLILTYDSLFNGSNQIEFFDVGTTAVRYGINKVGTGNRLTIQGNSPLSTFDMGLMIDAPNNTIKTYFGSNFDEKGIKLDFDNNVYEIGVDNFGVTVDYNIGVSYVGDYIGSYLNGTTLSIDANNNIIKTFNVGGDIGLKLDFANNNFRLGDVNAGNGSYVEVDGWNIYLKGSNNNTWFEIDDNNSIIKSTYGGSERGLYLNLNFIKYGLGESNGGFINNDIFGILVDGGNGYVLVGDTFANNKIHFNIDTINNSIKSWSNNTQIGLSIDNTLNQYTLGSTTEYLGIDTLNDTLIAGANLLSGTAGGASGQHLKININGTDYKIELRNP